MTDTEPLEVKNLVLKNDDTNIVTESQIEANVGESEMVALVEEATADASNEMESESMEVEHNTNNTATEETKEKVTEENNRISIPNADLNGDIIVSSPISNQQTSTACEKLEEKILSSEDALKNTAASEDVFKSDKASNDQQINDIATEVSIDNNITSKEVADNIEKNISENNSKEEVESHIPEEEISNKETKTVDNNKTIEINETKENQVPSDESCFSENIETIPSTTNGIKTLIEDNPSIENNEQESISTQTVLQTPEDIPVAHMDVNEENEAQNNINPSMNDSFSEISETLLNHTDPSNNVLKSVVDTTINDIITPSTTALVTRPEPNVKMPITVTTSSQSQGSLSIGQGPQPNGSHGLPMLVKPPKTDVLLQTAREVLQLRDDPQPATNILIGTILLFSIFKVFVLFFCKIIKFSNIRF